MSTGLSDSCRLVHLQTCSLHGPQAAHVLVGFCRHFLPCICEGHKKYVVQAPNWTLKLNTGEHVSTNWLMPLTLNPKPQTPNPKPKALNPQPAILNPQSLRPGLVGYLELEARVAGVVKHLGEIVRQGQPRVLCEFRVQGLGFRDLGFRV